MPPVPYRDPIAEEIQRVDAPPVVDINAIVAGLGSGQSQTQAISVPLTSPDAEAARARAKKLVPEIDLRLEQGEQDALKFLHDSVRETEAQAEVAKLTHDEIQARKRQQDIDKNKIANDLHLQLIEDAVGWNVADETKQLSIELANLANQRKDLENTSILNPIGKIINTVQVSVAQKRIKNVEDNIKRGLALQTDAMNAATTSAQALSVLQPEAESNSLQAANQRAIDAKMTAAKSAAGVVYDEKIAASSLTKYGLMGNELQQSLSLLQSVNEGKRMAKQDADAYLNTLKDWTALGQVGANPAYIKMFTDKTGLPTSSWLGMPAASRGMLINYWAGGASAISNSPTEDELAAANTAISVAPDVLHRELGRNLNIAMAEELKTVGKTTGGQGVLIGKMSVDPTTGKTSGDLNREKLFNTPIPMTIGGQYFGKATVPQILEFGAFQKPGSAVGRALYSSPESSLFADSGKPGSSIMKDMLVKLNGVPEAKIPPTIGPNSEIRFEDIRAMGKEKNNPAEIYGFFKEMQRQASLRVPYAFYGVKPAEIPLGIKYNYQKPGVFGAEDVTGVLRPKTVEDVINAMHRQDIQVPARTSLTGLPASY